MYIMKGWFVRENGKTKPVGGGGRVKLEMVKPKECGKKKRGRLRWYGKEIRPRDVKVSREKWV